MLVRLAPGDCVSNVSSLSDPSNSLMVKSVTYIYRVPTAQGKQGKWGKWPKNYLSWKHRKFENMPKRRENTRNLIWSSCKFSDCKGKKYCDICLKNFHSYF